MDQKTSVSVTIVNRNYPPSSGITGVSAHELAGYLERQGVEVKVVTIDGQYEGGVSVFKGNGNIIRLPAWHTGKHKLKRLIGSVIEAYFLVKKAIQVNEGTIILMTDPPFLHFWAALLFGKKTQWMLWAMDVYPEAFAANGLIAKDHILYRFFIKKIKKSIPKKLIALGPFQAAFINKRYPSKIPNFILPCGVYKKDNKEAVLPKWRKKDAKIYFGYIGNLGEAHSLKTIKTLIEQLDPTKHHFILSVYGSKANSILDFVKDNPVVTIVQSVARHQLSFIDIHAISLLPSWNHVCVPSKAVSGVCAGSTILFFGSSQVDTWNLLKEAGWNIEGEGQLEEQIQLFLATLSAEEIAVKKMYAEQVAIELQVIMEKGFKQITACLKNQEITLVKKSSHISYPINQLTLVSENNTRKSNP